MFKMARFATLLGLGLAISSFIGLMARHLPPLTVGLWVVLLILLVLTLMSYFAGPLLDQHFGWGEDTSLGLAIALFLVFMIGGLIGWLAS
ncbi:hypothetical protein NIES2135_46510 [Leptolyngbya boryana NIES-2135]|jgi:antibiotic biosynthesis monooxygenase (ABM) superfamily enzyme|uniref:Uncharacterized protein n=2 Tax=Leptolyngbya group TaxID=3081713 RepID=A0A1Z4JM47_LEPBY|nr:hypothetical protein [Leptolyngbya sp. FACHB-161]MBD2373750.1 hypothetical protein [Leptolyngbya sp. FACHB-238]MBD2398451.1 hypothetical protein [Leptolyngbya sp. FACHB-239]MBD2404052.1 hypothetical protein [Leptolyngbya sp. FACHB-402]MBN8559965.1 hypothetical protein [Leptolyngbya sp. UWPOB_LEPTO1]BAS56050.1 hypothetical protein LBWT_19600 [Leptolyngbya boryana IAM M-101]BAS62398.1 hypothetical protein LBDG_19600 [Leptolyngbya boryana dg5]BAY57780.1 hypothetical protein NIES2135_46510 [L